jgi:hypothetical protein
VGNVHARPAIALQIYRALETSMLPVIVTRHPLERLYKMSHINLEADNISGFILLHVQGNVLVNKFPQRQILDKQFVAWLRNNR